ALVQVPRNANIEAALVRNIGSLAFRLAKGKIFIDRLAEVLFERPHIGAAVTDHVAYSENPSVKHLVFGAIQDRPVITPMLKCLAHERIPSFVRKSMASAT